MFADEEPDMERGAKPVKSVKSKTVYLCVRPANVRGAASVQHGAMFPDKVKPGTEVVVVEEVQLHGHRRGRLKSKAEEKWVSLSNGKGQILFEPVDGALNVALFAGSWVLVLTGWLSLQGLGRVAESITSSAQQVCAARTTRASASPSSASRVRPCYLVPAAVSSQARAHAPHLFATFSTAAAAAVETVAVEVDASPWAAAAAAAPAQLERSDGNATPCTVLDHATRQNKNISIVRARYCGLCFLLFLALFCFFLRSLPSPSPPSRVLFAPRAFSFLPFFSFFCVLSFRSPFSFFFLRRLCSVFGRSGTMMPQRAAQRAAHREA